MTLDVEGVSKYLNIHRRIGDHSDAVAKNEDTTQYHILHHAAHEPTSSNESRVSKLLSDQS